MHALELIKTPGKAADKSLIAVYGDDAYLRREAINTLVRALLGDSDPELALTRFSGDKVLLADVLDEVRTLPFLVKRRVVVVDEADPFVTAHRKELESFADAAPAPGALILSTKTWMTTTKLAKAVSKVGLSVECKTPPEAELPRWLVQIARADKVKLHDDAARLLLDLVGPEIGLLSMEVDKLTVYVGERKEIDRDDVARLVGSGRVEKIWQAVDSACSGNAGIALENLDRLMAAGEHPVGLLAGMTFSLRKVHHAGQLRRTRRDLATAAREAGAYSAEQIGKQHAHLGPSRVDKLPALLLQADLDLKGSSNLPVETIMERLMVRLAATRKD